MRLFTIFSDDRTMTREEWKVLDRASRALGRKHEALISEHAKHMLLYGVAGYHVGADGEIIVGTPDEVNMAMLRKPTTPRKEKSHE